MKRISTDLTKAKSNREARLFVDVNPWTFNKLHLIGIEHSHWSDCDRVDRKLIIS